MDVLFASSIISDKDFNELLSRSKDVKPSIAGQRFEKMIATGIKDNDVKIQVLSYSPVIPFPKSDIIYWQSKKTKHEDVNIKYLPFLNFPLIKQFMISFGTLIYLLKWIVRNRQKEKRILFSVVYLPAALPGLILSKFPRVKNAVVVPDVSSHRFNYDSANPVRSLINKAKTIVSERVDPLFDSYLFLTKDMNNLMNKKSRPHLIVEGMIDNRIIKNNKIKSNCPSNKNFIMYAGTLREKYGISKLIDAFLELDFPDIDLYIFGTGEQEKYLKELSNNKKNIKFFGLQPFEVVYEYEANALLLINPRPTNEEFVKYSFPSKTLEYMSSGTPLLTTPLPGIPEEYNSYIYILENDSVSGIKKGLKQALEKDKNELYHFGKLAQEFVKNNKNYKVQTLKIINFLKKL